MGAPESDRAGIRQTIRALRAAGYTVTMVHNGEDPERFAPEASEDSIIEAAMATDASTLYVRAPGEGDLRSRERGYVYFVLGNDPEEVICDHTVNLSATLDALTERWES